MIRLVMSNRSALKRSMVLRYGLAAALLPSLALLLHLGMVGLFGAGQGPGTYHFFLAAVALSAVWAGRFFGILTLIISVLLRLYFFVPPVHSFAILEISALVHITLFTGLGVLIALIGGGLHESEERFSTALTSIGDAVIATDERHVVSFMNPVAELLSGWSARLASGRSVEEVVQLVNERTEGRVELPIAAALQRREAVRLPEDTSLVSRSGITVPIEDSAAPIRAGAGEPRGAILVFRDVTEQRKAREALRESEARYRFLADAVPEFIFTATSAGECDYFNRRWYDYTGFTAEQSSGYRWISALHPEDITSALSQLTASIESGKGFELECRVAGTDRSYRTFLMRGLPMPDETGEIQKLFGVFTDIEDLKRKEAQLLQVQKLEAIGRLAGGVAHDFNNLLTVIAGYSTMQRDDAAHGSVQRAQAEQICWAADRAAALTRQLLTFSRRQIVQPVVLDLNAVVREAEQVLRRLIGEDIGIEIVLDPQPMLSRVDRDQMIQVILNLAVNSRDAMPQGGRLIIETAKLNLSQADLPEHVIVRPGSYVLLTVRDTGAGMDAETQSHALEPFFTTKEPGKGTGLGLSTAYGVVTQSGGYLSLHTELGKGTAVKIYLPVVEEPQNLERAPAAARPNFKGTETILVLEDQEDVRNLIEAILTQQGYKVLKAGDAEEALRLCKSRVGPIDLLLTDMVMPGMSGRRAAEEAVKHRPGLKVIYMSGHTDETILHHAGPEFGGEVIQKPFTSELLLQKIRQALDTPAPPERS